MSIAPHDLIILARQLPTDHEAANRTSASCAYYAAYHACQQTYKALPQPQATGMHKGFIQSLQTSPASLDRKIGYILKSMHDTRIQADYKLSDDFTTTQRQKAIEEAQRIITLLGI